MFEFVCEHIIPGCTAKETGDTVEECREKAQSHLHKHHDIQHSDSGPWEKIDLAIATIRTR
jgi:predicted RNase H-like HicB family nuclease